MIEVMATPDIQVGKLYSTQDLVTVLQGGEFQQLRPSFEQADSLDPQELTVDMVEALTDTIMDSGIVNAHLGKHSRVKGFNFEAEVEGVGKLTFIGAGEMKTVLLLTTDEGKKLALSIFQYQEDLGLQVPEDPRFTRVYQSGRSRQLIYSDLATYLVLPLSVRVERDLCLGIAFQEYAEPTRVKSTFAPVTRWFVSGRAMGEIDNLAHSEGWERMAFDDDILRPEHFFFIGGRWAIIDVKVNYLHSN